MADKLEQLKLLVTLMFSLKTDFVCGEVRSDPSMYEHCLVCKLSTKLYVLVSFHISQCEDISVIYLCDLQMGIRAAGR